MSKKVDKGFQLIYWKLSYRRRFIRNLWTIPIMIIAIGLIVWRGNGVFIGKIMPLILITLSIVETTYNYLKWKKVE